MLWRARINKTKKVVSPASCEAAEQTQLAAKDIASQEQRPASPRIPKGLAAPELPSIPQELLNTSEVSDNSTTDIDTDTSFTQNLQQFYKQQDFGDQSQSRQQALLEAEAKRRMEQETLEVEAKLRAQQLALERNCEELEAKLRAQQEQEEKVAAWEASQAKHTETLEARESELRAREAAWRTEAEAQMEEMKRLEEAQMTSTDEDKEKQLTEERHALERLQEEAKEKHIQLEENQESARKKWEERELQVLEEESEQRRLGQELLDERERLAAQRKSLTLLQAGLMEQLPKGPSRVRLDTDCANETAFDESFSPVKGEDKAEDDDRSGSDTDEEVWDLDWSQLDAKAGEEGEKDGRDAVTGDEQTGGASSKAS